MPVQGQLFQALRSAALFSFMLAMPATLPADEDAGMPPEGLPEPPIPTQTYVRQGTAQVDETRFFRMMFGTYVGENAGLHDGYLSLEGQTGLFSSGGDRLFFMDTRLLLSDYTNAGANLGGGVRRYLSGPNVIVGANVYYDRWQAEYATFDQIGAGVELLGSDWSLRSNVYAPVGGQSKQYGPINAFVVPNGNDIFATTTYETALTGFDVEYGQLLRSTERTDLSGYIGTYYYTGDGEGNDALGVRARGELAIGDATRLNLSLQNDSIFDTTLMFGAEISLFDRGGRRYRGNTYSRMTERVQRQMNIATTTYGETADTGLDAFFVQEGATGSGAQADPFSLADLGSNPNFGENDVAFLVNSGGPIAGNFVLDDFGQQLAGSPDASGVATVILPNGAILTQGGLGGRATLTGQVQFNTGGRISGFDFNSPTVIPIFIDGVAAGQTATIDSVNILGSIDDGIQVQNSPGTVEFLAGTGGGLIQDVAGDGIQVIGSTDVLLDNVTFNNIGQNAIRTNYTGTFIGTGNTVINNPGFNGIYLTNNNNSTFQFENLTINGGGNGLYLGGFTGDFTVTGDAIFNKQVSTAIIHPSAAAGNTSNLRFGTLTIDQESGYAIALENHQGSLTVDGAATINGTEDHPTAIGILSNVSTTDFNFGSLEMNHVGHGVAMEQHNGKFNVDGAAVIRGSETTPVTLGILSEGSKTDFSFGSLEISDSGTAVALINHKGDFTSEGLVNFDNYRIFGFQIEGGESNVDIDSLRIVDKDDHSGIGIALTSNTGDFTVRNNAKLSNNRLGGILLQGGKGNVSFGSLDITHDDFYEGYGVSLEGHKGTFNVDGDANFTQTGLWGIQARDSNTDFTFGNLNINNNSNFAVALDNHEGDFTVTGDADFINPWQYGMQVRNSHANVSFGTLSTSNTAQYGVALDNSVGTFTVDGAADFVNVGNFGFVSTGYSVGGDINFGSVDITGANLVGFSVSGGTGDITIDEHLNVDSNTTGVEIANRNGDLSFGSISTNNTAETGVNINNTSGSITVTDDLIVKNAGTRLSWTRKGSGVSLIGNDGPISIGNVEIDGEGLVGLDLTNNKQGFTITGADGGLSSNSGGKTSGLEGGLTVEGFGIGMNASGNSGDLNLANVTITGVGRDPEPWSPGEGMVVVNQTGSVIVNGDTKITNSGNHGISLENISGDVGFGNIDVEDSLLTGVNLRNVSGDVNINGDVEITKPGSIGMNLQEVGGETTITGDLHVDGATATSVNISDGPKSFTVEGDTLLENSHQGLAVIDSKTDLNFNNLTIQNTTANGLSLYNSTSNVNVTGDAKFDNTGSSAILADGNSSGSFTFNNLEVTNNWGIGVSLNHFDGDFTVNGDADFKDAGGTAFLSQGNSTGNYTFNNLDISGSWTSGLALVNHTGDLTVNGIADINGGQIGLQIEGGSGVTTFNELNISGSGTNGISLFQGTKSFNATKVDIVSPGANGLIIQSTAAVIDIDELNVSSPGANGVSMALFDGDLTISGGTISGIQSGHQGIFRHDSGSNSSITLENMTFTTDANDVFGMITLEHGNGGSVTLNNNSVVFADGSTGTIAYRLGSYGVGNNVKLFGTGNTSTNAVQPFFLDTLPDSFDGTVEIDGSNQPL